MNDYNPRLGMADLVIQGVLLTLVIVPDVFSLFTENTALLIGMFFQIFLGVYQVMSGVIGGIKRRGGRGQYLTVAGIYMFFFTIGTFVFDSLGLSSYFSMLLFAFLIIIVPVSIGIWYFVSCINEYKTHKVSSVVTDMSDILDVGLQ